MCPVVISREDIDILVELVKNQIYGDDMMYKKIKSMKRGAIFEYFKTSQNSRASSLQQQEGFNAHKEEDGGCFAKVF